MERRTKLTDKQKKKIIADYIECQNYSEVARKWKLSVNGVKKIVLCDEFSAKQCKQKREENTDEMLNYLESRKDLVLSFFDKALVSLNSQDKLAMATLNQVATAFGIIYDKMISNPQQANNDKLEKLRALYKEDNVKQKTE